MEVLQRPGGELATRPIHFFWVVDCSGSMYGEKIGIVNNTIQECIPEMRSAADNNPNAQLLIRALQFSSGASWITSSPVPVEDYGWEDMDANGLTELGKAFDLLAAQLSIPPMPERALPPVIVLLSDGQPTDDYKKSMEKLKKRPWFRKAVKIAISIGQDADDEVLIEFAGRFLSARYRADERTFRGNAGFPGKITEKMERFLQVQACIAKTVRTWENLC